MNQSDMRDRRIACEHPFDILRRRADIVGRFEYRELAPHHLGELGHALAIGAVDQHEHMAVARNQRVDGRFDSKGAAALQRHANMSAVRFNHT